MFDQFYGPTTNIHFTQVEPWTLYEFPDLKIVVAAMNSTMGESHEDGTHFGLLGEKQLEWFAEKMVRYKVEEWFRLGVLHHNVERGAVNDDENLHDRADLQHLLGNSLNLLLHGHTHNAQMGWLNQYTPILATGSAALRQEQRPDEVPNQYQIVTVRHGGIERRLRRYQGKRWLGDTSLSQKGGEWKLGDAVSFQNVSAAITPPVEFLPSGPLVRITKPVTAEEATRKLSILPRLVLHADDHQEAVRQAEQEKLADILRIRHSVWLVADWQQGKEGFLGSALARITTAEVLQSVFRLQCGSASSCAEVLAAAETQLGLSFPEFSEAISRLPEAFLVLDDIPQVIAVGKEREFFDSTLRTLFDFAPKLKLILVSRQIPRMTNPDEYVVLRALDLPEVGDYLRLHPRQHARSRTAATALNVDQIYNWSGGLPMHLDRLIERLEHINLHEILGEESPVHVATASEPVPDSLVRSYRELAESDQKVARKSIRLLKVLTVMRDGETYETIRRFFHQEPFYQENIDQLVQHSLIESVPISQSTPTLGLRNTPVISEHETPRLLRVPRQVRDYVNALMTDAERDEIISASMGFLFGATWFRRVKLRNTLTNVYAQSALSGPGNEHVIVRLVLSRAIHRGNKKQVTRYLRVFISYCGKLISENRFRDAAIATGAILDLLKAQTIDKEFVELAQLHGRSLRMIGDEPQAINVLEGIVDAEVPMTDEFRAEIWINLALAYQKSDRTADALEAAKKVEELSHPDSNNAFQARAVNADLTLAGAPLRTRLRELEDSARRKGCRVVADNIALDLARDLEDPEEALSMLEKVLQANGDTYNRTRAIIEKAAILSKHLRFSAMHPRDYRILSEAYSYCYAQRFGALLDRCHRVLWGMCVREKMSMVLLRLFRFSSFIWRLRGEESREQQYLRELETIDINSAEATGSEGVSVEIIYIQRRRIMLAQKVAPSP